MIVVHYEDGSRFDFRQSKQLTWKSVADKDKIIALEIVSELTDERHTLWRDIEKPGILFAQRVGVAALGRFCQHVVCKGVDDVSAFFESKIGLARQPHPDKPNKILNVPTEFLFLKPRCPRCGGQLTLQKIRFDIGSKHNEPLVAEQAVLVHDAAGNCSVLEVHAKGYRRYESNLKSLGLNDVSLKQLGVSLSILRKPKRR